MKILLFSAVLVLAGCTGLPCSKTAILDAKKDQVLYLKSKSPSIYQDYRDNPIEVSVNGMQIGKIYEDKNSDYNLIFQRYKDGKKFKLWRYYDYSGVEKISQSQDETKIRVYHYRTLLVSNCYVTVINLGNYSVNNYSLSKEDYNELTH